MPPFKDGTSSYGELTYDQQSTFKRGCGCSFLGGGCSWALYLQARKQAVRLRESRLSPGRAPSRVEKYADRVNQIVTSPLFTNSIMLLIMSLDEKT